ncbi:hexapeptide repeat-containing acetyltransferase domain protein, partial [Vibrio parahaemolyticus V-223/04]
MMTRFTGV